MSERTTQWFEGPAGRLDARVEGPEDGVSVVLCAPHPEAEGSMGSRLVYDLAVGLAGAGCRTFRFDYRGVGRSEGTYGMGDGEAEDALAVHDAVAAPRGENVAMVGHSFGGGVALRVAARRDVGVLVLIATPPLVSMSALRPLVEAPHVMGRVVVVVGTDDPFVSVADAKRLAEAFPEPAELVVLDGADHFLSPQHTPRALAVVRSVVAGL